MERDLSRYENGKIYSIRSHQTDKYYIGSSCNDLCKRLYLHRHHYKHYLKNKLKYMSSFEIIKYDDHYIEVIEDYPCKSKRELEKREGELQRQYKNDIVNNRNAHRTSEQREEYYKQYDNEHKEQKAEKQKKNYQDNKEKILEYQKQYKAKNKEKVSEKQKIYREKKKAENN